MRVQTRHSTPRSDKQQGESSKKSVGVPGVVSRGFAGARGKDLKAGLGLHWGTFGQGLGKLQLNFHVRLNFIA